jgi:hypothetical protein
MTGFLVDDLPLCLSSPPQPQSVPAAVLRALIVTIAPDLCRVSSVGSARASPLLLSLTAVAVRVSGTSGLFHPTRCCSTIHPILVDRDVDFGPASTGPGSLQIHILRRRDRCEAIGWIGDFCASTKNCQQPVIRHPNINLSATTSLHTARLQTPQARPTFP